MEQIAKSDKIDSYEIGPELKSSYKSISPKKAHKQ